jgi:hypothetical protein
VGQLELPPIIEAVIDSTRSAADAKGIRIQTAIDPRAGVVAADPERLQQMFRNLLSNAVKFTPKGGRPTRTLAGVRVLVVDDEPDTLETVETVLAQCGAEVRVAVSAAAALGTMAEWTPDLVVSDIGMPGEDGYALIKRIRAHDTAAGGSSPRTWWRW